MRDLLEPSTTEEQLNAITGLARIGNPNLSFCLYLQVKSKQLDIGEWLVDGKNSEKRVHNGAHFPLIVFTNNSSARSQPAEARRKVKLRISSVKGDWAQHEFIPNSNRPHYEMRVTNRNEPANLEPQWGCWA